jgi:hypothetical protein
MRGTGASSRVVSPVSKCNSNGGPMGKSTSPAPTTRDLLKQEFTALCQQRDAALAQAAPLRAQRDKIVAEGEAAIAAHIAPLNDQIIAAENGLPDIMNQIAQIANALNGQTA